LCLIGARPSRVCEVCGRASRELSARCSARHASLPGGGGVQVNYDASSDEVTRPCRVEEGAQVNHGAWPHGEKVNVKG
jgi:hypothetical protein